MSYIIKNTSALINTLITDAARKKISQGNFDIAYFEVGDSEVCYNCINGLDPVDLNVLMPQYNAQSLSPAPEKNRMHVKYPLFLDSTSGSTFGVPFDNSYIDNVYNTAAPRGFFSGSTGTPTNFSAFTSSALTINPNFFVSNSGLTSGTVLTLSATTIDPSVSGNVTPGMFITLYTGPSVTPITGNGQLFTYLVVGITGDTSTGSSVTIEVDRQLPDLFSLGFSGGSSVMFYPSGMTELYDTFTPQPYWATDVFNFETNCDVSQRNVQIWNMNIPWTESPAGVFNSTYQDYNYYSSSGYVGTKEYLGYNNKLGQRDTDSVYYYNSFEEKITVPSYDQKSVAIVHYTNQAIDNFYGEKFAMQDFDPANPGNTGQARNFKIHLPWLMWHKNPNATIGETFYTDPSGFTNQNLFTVHYIKSARGANFNTPGLRYYHLWDTHADSNGIPNRVGKVFPDLKIIVFDDDEIISALSYKANRTWTLPAPKLGLVTPNTFSGVLGGTAGLLSGDSETLFLTYRLNNTAYTNSLHCNYYTKISGNDQSLLKGASDILVRFGSEFPFLSDPTTSTSGFNATDIRILAQKVPSGTTRPDPSQWREIDVYNQISASTVNGYLNQSGLTGNTIQITKTLYDNAPYYHLENYISIPQIGQTGLTMNFGSEYYFYGNVETDIQATIYVMNFLCNLGQTQFFDSSNPTWDNSKPIYVTEVALYNKDKELMVISKIQSPQKRQGIQQYPIKLDF
jgi:hypothetical protein